MKIVLRKEIHKRCEPSLLQLEKKRQFHVCEMRFCTGSWAEKPVWVTEAINLELCQCWQKPVSNDASQLSSNTLNEGRISEKGAATLNQKKISQTYYREKCIMVQWNKALNVLAVISKSMFDTNNTSRHRKRVLFHQLELGVWAIAVSKGGKSRSRSRK